MLLLAPKPMFTAAVAIRPQPSSSRADTPVLSTPESSGKVIVRKTVSVPVGQMQGSSHKDSRQD
jgi:hypothetical protein